MRVVASLMVAIFAFPTLAAGQELDVSAELDRRSARADRMIRVGDAGLAAIALLGLAGEVGGYDDKLWMRTGVTASLGAIVTGIVGRKLKRDVERERKNRHAVAVAPLGGSGVAGVYSFSW